MNKATTPFIAVAIGFAFSLQTASAAPNQLTGSHAEQGSYEVQPIEVRSTSGGTSRVVDDDSGIVLRYDLSAIPQDTTVYSSIEWRGKSSGSGSTPSLTVWALNKEGEKVTRVRQFGFNTNQTRLVPFRVSSFVREHLKDGILSFLIEMHSTPGFSQQVEFSGSPVLEVVKEQQYNYQLSDLLYPVWKGNRMVNETSVPTSYDGKPAVAKLAFIPSKIIEVKNYALDRSYTEGKDYTVEGQTLRLTPASSIPFFHYSDLYHNNPDARPGVMKTLDGGYLTFGELPFITDRQLAVTYEHEEPWEGPIPQAAGANLPQTFARLNAGQPLKIVVFGDSISGGGSASGNQGIAPWMPRWSDLIVQALKDATGSSIEYLNLSIGGMSSIWGREAVEGLVVHEKPDLVILAFGMNDAGQHARLSTEKFIDNTQFMIDSIRRQNPQTEFILVMSFQPNPKWRDLELMASYLPALKKMEGPGVAIADVWSMHGYLLKHKTYWDMIVNHVNHPNDFIHRLYAQVILATLGRDEQVGKSLPNLSCYTGPTDTVGCEALK